MNGFDFRSGGDRLRRGLVERRGESKIHFVVGLAEHVAREILFFRSGGKLGQRLRGTELAAGPRAIASVSTRAPWSETVRAPHSVVTKRPAPVSTRSTIKTMRNARWLDCMVRSDFLRFF